MDDIDTRITRLLNQLENPELTEPEITTIKGKITYLEARKQA